MSSGGRVRFSLEAAPGRPRSLALVDASEDDEWDKKPSNKRRRDDDDDDSHEEEQQQQQQELKRRMVPMYGRPRFLTQSRLRHNMRRHKMFRREYYGADFYRPKMLIQGQRVGLEPGFEIPRDRLLTPVELMMVYGQQLAKEQKESMDKLKQVLKRCTDSGHAPPLHVQLWRAQLMATIARPGVDANKFLTQPSSRPNVVQPMYRPLFAVEEKSVVESMRPTFAVNLFQHGFSMNSDREGFMPYDRQGQELLHAIDKGTLPPFARRMLKAFKCYWYDGCILCEVIDFRHCTHSARDPVTRRVLLRPTAESLVSDVDDMCETDELRLAVEAELLKTLHSEVVLDPNPVHMQLANLAQYNRRLDTPPRFSPRELRATRVSRLAPTPSPEPPPPLPAAAMPFDEADLVNFKALGELEDDRKKNSKKKKQQRGQPGPSSLPSSSSSPRITEEEAKMFSRTTHLLKTANFVFSTAPYLSNAAHNCLILDPYLRTNVFNTNIKSSGRVTTIHSDSSIPVVLPANRKLPVSAAAKKKSSSSSSSANPPPAQSRRPPNAGQLVQNQVVTGNSQDLRSTIVNIERRCNDVRQQIQDLQNSIRTNKALNAESLEKTQQAIQQRHKYLEQLNYTLLQYKAKLKQNQ